MKANELRIGNLVRRRKKVLKVGIIQHDKILVSGYSWCKYFKCEDLYPIQITEEWLLKLGFECIADAGDQKRFALKNRKPNYYYGVELDHEEICLNKQSLFGCETIIHNEIFFQYVHQLQNLYFALTGEELTIKY